MHSAIQLLHGVHLQIRNAYKINSKILDSLVKYNMYTGILRVDSPSSKMKDLIWRWCHQLSSFKLGISASCPKGQISIHEIFNFQGMRSDMADYSFGIVQVLTFQSFWHVECWTLKQSCGRIMCTWHSSLRVWLMALIFMNFSWLFNWLNQIVNSLVGRSTPWHSCRSFPAETGGIER